MICYAVIDTNVLVSALLSRYNNTATVQIAARMIAGEIVPIYSRGIMQEYYVVLSRQKFGFPQEMIDYLLAAVRKYGLLVEPMHTDIILPDVKDQPFYEAVLEKKEDGAYLVTGNMKHFPQKDFIVTARQFIDILDSRKPIT